MLLSVRFSGAADFFGYCRCRCYIWLLLLLFFFFSFVCALFSILPSCLALLSVYASRALCLHNYTTHIIMNTNTHSMVVFFCQFEFGRFVLYVAIYTQSTYMCAIYGERGNTNKIKKNNEPHKFQKTHVISDTIFVFAKP